MIVVTKYSKLSLEVKLLLFHYFTFLYKLLYSATGACVIFTWYYICLDVSLETLAFD